MKTQKNHSLSSVFKRYKTGVLTRNGLIVMEAFKSISFEALKNQRILYFLRNYKEAFIRDFASNIKRI